jgi:hypothetical protein
MSELSAPSKIFQRICPLLVTVEMTDRPWRLLLTRTTGVWPLGAKLRPRTSSLRSPLSSPQWISAPFGLGARGDRPGSPRRATS